MLHFLKPFLFEKAHQVLTSTKGKIWNSIDTMEYRKQPTFPKSAVYTFAIRNIHQKFSTDLYRMYLLCIRYIYELTNKEILHVSIYEKEQHTNGFFYWQHIFSLRILSSATGPSYSPVQQTHTSPSIPSCLSTCIYAKSLPQHRKLIEETIYVLAI